MRYVTPRTAANSLSAFTLEGEQRLLIEFADRGSGFAPEALPLTLDRFWRAQSARSQHTAGSGLGLSIASAISAAHGGSLAVMNRDGGGAIIRITLPAAYPPQQLASATQRAL